MSKNIFKPALDAISDKNLGIFGPTSFQDYLRDNELPSVRTAESISIDTKERLPSLLRENDAMVLRLGTSPNGTGTQFVLAKVKNRLDDFFLKDEDIVRTLMHINDGGATFLPSASMRKLFAYQILPVFSETSFINLGMASGLISYALRLDEEKSLVAPATGASTFTFKLKAHSKLNKEMVHNKGQIEIDALFVEKRDGKETLFILEAKSGRIGKSLAKHKLVYPILALAKHVPRDIPIVPVYMKVFKSKDGLHFIVTECEFPDPRRGIRAINELSFEMTSHLILPF